MMTLLITDLHYDDTYKDFIYNDITYKWFALWQDFTYKNLNYIGFTYKSK
jgi:hypothetical protein